MLNKIALRNVLSHWRQSLAALLSISAAFFCLVIFQGYMLDVERLYWDGYRNRSMYGDVILENREATSVQAQSEPWRFELDEKDQELIGAYLNAEGASQVQEHVRFLNFSGLVTTGISSKIFLAQAFDLDRGERMREQWSWNVLYGKPLHKAVDENPLLVGQSLGFQLGCEPEKKEYSLLPEGGYKPVLRPFNCRRPDVQLSVTTESGNLNAMDFTIVGLMDSGYKDLDSRYLTLPLPLAQQLLNTKKLSYWSVKLKPGVSVSSWIDGMNRQFQNKAPHLHAIAWQDHRLGEMYLKTMSLLNIFRNFVTIVVAFISVLSVTNTMFKIVKERTREIGTLLSLGFQRSQVLSIFLREALFLSLIGCICGALLALGVTAVVNNASITYKAGVLSEPALFRIMTNLDLYVVALALLMLVTVVTSYVSCRSTVQRKIVDCLGHV
ncbi:MAG: FtsX-like permease family protein [Bdellovibrionaceae bacterium]|nr:FtsX-like permease family protein [Pseudobdellovibrionaceae bacterium]